ncbi:Uncharacterised protein [uncultured archaeon]|nr:Uncharacterised protein [uncultured archaeon]
MWSPSGNNFDFEQAFFSFTLGMPGHQPPNDRKTDQTQGAVINWLLHLRLKDIFLQTRAEQTKIFISNEKGLYKGGRMDLITVIEDLQALIVLVIFLMIIAVGFKIWAWNFSVPHK